MPALAQQSPTLTPFRALCLVLAAAAPVGSQETPLHQREPFDQLTLTEEFENQVVDVFLLTRAGREVPRGRNEEVLRVRLVDFPEQPYEIEWKHISQVKTFEQILLEKAGSLLKTNDARGAYECIERIWQLDPDWPGLDRAISDYLWAEASNATRTRRLAEAMALLSELDRRAPGSEPVAQRMTAVVQRAFEERLMERDLAGASRFVTWAESDESAFDLRQWASIARKQRDAYILKRVAVAESLYRDRDYRGARMILDAILQAVPEDKAAAELIRKINTRHHGVVVGVTRAADPDRVAARSDWASRRVIELVHPDLVHVVDYVAEGAKYACSYGELTISPDNQSLLIKLHRNNDLTGYEVARALRSPASDVPTSILRESLIASVGVDRVYTVKVDYTRPLLQPAAMAAVPMTATPKQLFFEVSERDESSLSFVKQGVEGAAFEITERLFEEPAELIDAIRRREIHVIDRLTPIWAQQLAEDSDLVVGEYRFPTQHFLVPNSEKSLMSQRGARRAVCYAIPRETIVTQELLGGRVMPGCSALTGPFSLGRTQDDQLGYANDPKIGLRDYDPQLGLTLYAIAQNVTLTDQPGGDGELLPPTAGTDWSPLTLVHPDDALVRPMAQAVAGSLNAAGIACRLEALPAGVQRPEGDWDLWYVDVTMSDPLADIQWLMGDSGLVRSISPYLQDALRELSVVTRQSDARELLHKIHRFVHDELPVIPLWQLVEQHAYRRELKGLGGLPATLYQEIEAWHVSRD